MKIIMIDESKERLTMEVTVQENEGFDEIILSGRMDALGSNTVEAFISGRLDDKGAAGLRVLVSFEAVDYVSSAGLRVFVSVAKRLQAAEGRIVLWGMDVQVEEIFSFAGLDSLFSIHRNRDTAVSALITE